MFFFFSPLKRISTPRTLISLHDNFFQTLIINFLKVKSSISFSRFFGLPAHSIFFSIEHIKTQELTFLSEYFLITAFFCLSLFALFSLTPSSKKKYFLLKFQYENQLHFLVILALIFYLVLVYQQIDLAESNLLSFNHSMINDSLAIVSKFIIGFASICYLIFITQYLKKQKLVNFEYYILLFTAIFGFFLLCCTNDFITTYLAIELQGLAFYVLAAFKKSSNFSIESGVKYFILGSFSTAFFLLGTTFVYGFTGSLLLTDFHDFFIWMFSLSSLCILSDDLYLFQEIASLGESGLELFKPNFHYFNTKTGDSISPCLFEKMFERYYSLELVDYLIQKDSFQLNYTQSLFCTFLVSIHFQNFIVELVYHLKENLLIHKDFENLRFDLLQINYYENINVDDFNLQHGLMHEFTFQRLFEGDSYFYNVYRFVECCYLSECIWHMAAFAENLKLQGEVLTENSLSSGLSKVFIVMPAEWVLSLENFKINLDFEFAHLFNFQFYLISVLSILSLNKFFFQFLSADFFTNAAVFDFNFVVFGMILLLLALLFKLALAPFHLWSPDVYEGSPTSSTFFFIVLSKLGIFVFLLRVFYLSFSSFISYWQFYSILIATTSIFIGAVAGLKQRKLKSLLTYSSINNMGFVLLAFSVGNFEGIQIKFYYLIIYILTSLCLWAIVLNLRKKMDSEKQNKDLGDLALLQESHNIIAQNLAVTLFTMAGLPPLVGFLAKMGVFKALAGVSVYALSIVNILFSVIATFYYLRIVKIIFFENILVGSLYSAINSKKVFIINFFNFLLGFFFISPIFLYLYSYKITLFLNKSFY